MLRASIVSSKRTQDSIVVTARLLDGDEVVLERNLAYSLDTNPDQIRLDVANLISVYEQEQAIGNATEASERLNTVADETVEALQGFTQEGTA